MVVIDIKNIYKSFKIYKDKAFSLKERVLFRNRSKHSRHMVLNGLDIQIHSGEVVGLIGENGCGKSTLLKLMTRIMYPDSGTITVKGRVSSLLELGAGFHPDLTGRENIYTNAAIFGLAKKEIDLRLQDIIDFSELYEYIDSPVRTYSSGMYMRLAFSVAINVNADILLIDEILAVGDTNFQEKCFNKLEELKKEGITIVLVTHDSGVVQRFCMRAIWIRDGKIAFDGDAEGAVNTYHKYMNKKKIENYNNGRDYTIEDIEEVYKFFLGRETENQQVLLHQYNHYRHIRDLIDVILSSHEFAERAELNEFDKKSETEIIREFRAYMKREKNEVLSLGLNDGQSTGEASLQHEKDIYIKKAYIKGFETKKKIEVRPFQKMDIAIDYQIRKNEDDLILGFGCSIYYPDGTLCYSSSTHRDGLLLHHLDADGTVVFSIENLPLMNGSYSLSVHMEDEKGSRLDQIDDCVQFSVVSDDRSVGLVNIPHNWSQRN